MEELTETTGDFDLKGQALKLVSVNPCLVYDEHCLPYRITWETQAPFVRQDEMSSPHFDV